MFRVLDVTLRENGANEARARVLFPRFSAHNACDLEPPIQGGFLMREDASSAGDDFDSDKEFDLEEGSEQERAQVRREREHMRDFVRKLSAHDIRTGSWFSSLLSQALSSYTTKANWEYFQEKYAGVPADAIVEERIRLAARYASIEGGMSAGAYSGIAILAAPFIVPAAVGSALVDVSFTAKLQLQLAHDIAVLYRVPIDVSDPEDLWGLIRVAFTIKAGEVAEEGLLKAVPAIVKPLVKAFYKKEVITAGRALPVVGKYLLQRNVVKIGIPVVGVPLAIVLNNWTTVIAGRHARAVYRNQARILEVAETIAAKSLHPVLVLRVAWLMIVADGNPTADESQLMRHLVSSVRKRHNVVDEELSQLIEVDRADILHQVDVAPGDRGDLLIAARSVAEIDGTVNAGEQSVLDQLEQLCA